ncbi:MAG: methyltransferase domain-containing protein [Methylococcales bacterium]|nr:methyltransferase domain-containing protein [Methylococcales bacterium]
MDKISEDNTKSQIIGAYATYENFDEIAYLNANNDVKNAVDCGQIESGAEHFNLFGRAEQRRLLFKFDRSRKKQKMARLKPLLRTDMKMIENENSFDFLTSELRDQFSIIDATAVSSNGYDSDVMALIEKHKNGLILDCGAGSRDVYYYNVVNFEIVPYYSTDVLGVGEVLPFKTNSFDAVLSFAVLEHVKNPWLCAQEIVRVLKPGGDLICAVPFLQPMHGYPHHYYNMTATGLTNLFIDDINIVRHEVPDYLLPIWSLTWILDSWANGLEETDRTEFVNLKVSDLMGNPISYLSSKFVRGLNKEKNMEIASGTVIHGQKKTSITSQKLGIIR